MIRILLLAAALQSPQDTARLTVSIAIDRALASHPAVAFARASVDVAAADERQARAAWLPMVSLDGAVNKFQEPMIVYPLHRLDLRNPPVFDTDLSQVSLGASYTLFDFGARSAKAKAAASQRDAADASLGATEQQLIARTLGSYLRVLTARGVLDAENQRVAALAAEAQRARDRFAAGKTARLDTLRAAAELAVAAADRVASATNMELAEQDLARLMGVSFAAVHGAALSSVQLGRLGAETSNDRAAMVARAGSGNADLQAAARRADAAAASVGAAKAGRLPQFQATTAIVDRSNITGRWLSEWQVGVGMSWPLFTGGARTSAVNRAAASSRAAQEQLRMTRLTTEQQVDDARAAFDASRARVDALDAAVQQATEVARITALARDVGDGTQTDYLIAEANLFRARSGLVQARHAAVAARVELARVLGELNRAWIVTSLESQP
ncbi:MAG: TolC family protein [Gemmatimonadetes bacterium]|nr:TolC family protein [Gemmatimonadota bacterium]